MNTLLNKNLQIKINPLVISKWTSNLLKINPKIINYNGILIKLRKK